MSTKANWIVQALAQFDDKCRFETGRSNVLMVLNPESRIIGLIHLHGKTKVIKFDDPGYESVELAIPHLIKLFKLDRKTFLWDVKHGELSYSSRLTVDCKKEILYARLDEVFAYVLINKLGSNEAYFPPKIPEKIKIVEKIVIKEPPVKRPPAPIRSNTRSMDFFNSVINRNQNSNNRG